VYISAVCDEIEFGTGGLGGAICFLSSQTGLWRRAELLEQINLTSARRKMVLGGNAARLLKL
jgi:hypothetical protein